MEHTTRIELENLKDLHCGRIRRSQIRRCAPTHY